MRGLPTILSTMRLRCVLTPALLRSMPIRMLASTSVIGFALLGCASAPIEHSPELTLLGQSMGASKGNFFLCSSEGLLALHMARSYILGKRQQNAVLPYIGKTTFDQEMASDLFRRVDAGEIAYHFDFATDKLYACAARLSLTLAQPWTRARQCYARVDIPFLYFQEKERGTSKSIAVKTALARTRDRSVYPEALLVSLADEAYASTSPQEQRNFTEAVFWRCMFADQHL